MRQRINSSPLSSAGGLVAIVLWSGTFAFARSLSEQMGPITAGAAVYLIGGAFCALRLGWSAEAFRSRLRLPRSYLFGCGALFVGYTAAIYLAVGLARSREEVLEIALLNYLWPAATVVLSLPLLHQRAGPLLLPGTVLALSGVFLVMTASAPVSWAGFWQHGRTNPEAYVLALVAALAWALYSNLARRWSKPESAGAVELFVPATGIVLLLLRLLIAEPTRWSSRSAAEAVALATITTVAYALWDAAMRKGNLLLVVACSYLTPLLSTLVTCAYLGVQPRPKVWLGCLVLVIGSLLTWRSVSDRRAG